MYCINGLKTTAPKAAEAAVIPVASDRYLTNQLATTISTGVYRKLVPIPKRIP